LTGELGDLGSQGAVQVGAGRHDRNRLDAEQAEQEVVAARMPVVAAGHSLLEQEPAVQSFARRRGERQPAMIGLDRSDREQRIGALRQGVGDQELELARLVAAAGEASEIVALDVDVGPAQEPGQPR